jgi:type II secretory pathway component PulJ
MKKIILSAMAFMMLFSCQRSDQLIQQQMQLLSVVARRRSACCTVTYFSVKNE